MGSSTIQASTHTIEEYMQAPYRMEVYWDETYWAVECPELPGLVAGGETWEDLHAAIEDAKHAWFASMLEDGKPIPEPRVTASEFSGKLVVRLPKTLHMLTARAAEQEGVSLNTFIVAAVARAVGYQDWRVVSEPVKARN